jgi:hypothetical protein
MSVNEGAHVSVSRRKRSRKSLTMVAAAAALVLSSCGGTAPGVAAQVDGRSITAGEVDDFARVLCALDGEAAATAPSKGARFRALEILLNIELSREVVDFGRADSGKVAEAVAQSASTREMVPEDVRDVFDRAVKEYAQAQLAITELGADSLREQGESQPDEQAAFIEGDRLRTQYAASGEVEVDRRFGELDNGMLVRTAGSISVPVSDVAVQGVAAEPAADFLTGLPASQTCGG